MTFISAAMCCVNFEAFANLVDVGGVDLELTGKEVEYVNGYLVEYNILLGRPEGTDYFDDTSGYGASERTSGTGILQKPLYRYGFRQNREAEKVLTG